MKNLILGFSLLLVAACSPHDRGAYTLIRSSIVGPGERIHVATFDASEGGGYNKTNCEIVADLMQDQPGVTVRYWCEPGRFQQS